MPDNQRAFYSQMKAFSDFDEIVQGRHFTPIPPDWLFVVTDVLNSTEAIRNGRYRDVNTLGAASIAAAQEAMPELDFPYVFAGDGATMAVPPDRSEVVIRALANVKSLALARFGLELRVGRVPVAELLEKGAEVEVAKLELVPGKSIAVFRGGGSALAERIVKEAPERYQISASAELDVPLNNLSCRWNAIPNRRGKILSVLICARTNDSTRIYEDVLRTLDSLLVGGLDQANPIHSPAMTYRSLRACVADERRYHRSVFCFAFLARFLEICAAVLIFKFKVHPIVINPSRYKHAMPRHSDYRKFADMFRAVVDCSPEAVKTFRAYLEALRARGELYYGLHESSTSLMTCYVHSVEDGQHIHFVDGGDGGYAMAAIELKRQMAGV